MAGFALSGSSSPSIFGFINQSSITISHGLGYRPSVWILDSGGSVIFADIVHDSISQITITFCTNISGSVYIR